MPTMTRLFLRLPMPKSLRKQFGLTLLAPALLIVAGGLVSFYDSRVSTQNTRQLSEVSMIRLQQARDLARHTLLIERESGYLLNTGAVDDMQASYLEIIDRLDLTDALVLALGQASNDLSILDLNQAGQLFRNTVHIVAQLRKNLLAGSLPPPELDREQAVLLEFKDELQRQAVSLVDATGALSAHFTQDFSEAMQQITATSEAQQRRALAFLTGSILLAWLVSRYFLRHRVSDRLQKVSDGLRLDTAFTEPALIPVTGNDEIGEMARSVEKFQEDRRLLVRTQKDLRQNVAELEKALDEIKTLRGIIPICSSCKKIRDDKGYWNRIETYISKHSEADFSHSLCPACVKKLYPDLDL
jgi:methyl-accepting chemotaxis protein